jgi:hypothetical protein
MAKVGKSDCEGTFTGAFGNDGVAPKLAVRLLWVERVELTHCDLKRPLASAGFWGAPIPSLAPHPRSISPRVPNRGNRR